VTKAGNRWIFVLEWVKQHSSKDPVFNALHSTLISQSEYYKAYTEVVGLNHRRKAQLRSIHGNSDEVQNVQNGLREVIKGFGEVLGEVKSKMEVMREMEEKLKEVKAKARELEVKIDYISITGKLPSIPQSQVEQGSETAVLEREISTGGDKEDTFA
jgi:seryl-tRNA synthetase